MLYLFIKTRRTLYPGPGYKNPVGEGLGYSVNVPLFPGTGDLAYEYVLDEILVPLAEGFHPEIILMVDGSDTHYSNRITYMGLTLLFPMYFLFSARILINTNEDS